LEKKRDMIARRTVLRRLNLEAEVLDRLEELELILPVKRPGKERAYYPDDVDRLRVYQVLVRELEVNPPGAEIILRMRSRLVEMQKRISRVLEEIENQGLLDDVREILSSLEEELW